MPLLINNSYFESNDKVKLILSKIVRAGFFLPKSYVTSAAYLNLHNLDAMDLTYIQKQLYVGEQIIDAISTWDDGTVEFTLCVELISK